MAENIDYGKKFEEDYENIKNNIKKPNVLVAGGTGVGKSALINLIFGEEKVKVGAGLPVTSGISEKLENEFISIYDSPGYESGDKNQTEYEENILKFIEDRETKDIEEQIHVVWYCISAPSNRVLDIDLNIIKRIKKHCPVAVVLTQVDSTSHEDLEELKKILTESVIGIEIFATSKDSKNNRALADYTGDDLVEWSLNNLDESLKQAFIAGLKSSLKIKYKNGQKIASAFGATAAGIAASPIPFSDAPLLVGNQIAMIASLSYNWDLPGIKSVASGSILSQLVSQLGRTLAGNLLKWFPILGSVAGAAINATVATSITVAIGLAINEVCYRIAKDQIDGKTIEFAKYFSEGVLKGLIKEYLEKKK